MARWTAALLLLLAAASPAAAAPGTVTYSNEFEVTGPTPATGASNGLQGFNPYEPSAGTDRAGRSLVVWSQETRWMVPGSLGERRDHRVIGATVDGSAVSRKYLSPYSDECCIRNYMSEPSLAVEPGGKAIVAWSGTVAEQPGVERMYISRGTTEGLETGQVVGTGDEFADRLPPVAIGPTGQAVAVFSDYDENSRTFLRAWTGDGPLQTISDMSKQGGSAAPAVAADGTVAVAWSDGTGVVARLKPPGGAWGPIEPVGADGSPHRLAFDAAGRLILGTVGDEGIYRRAEGGGWSPLVPLTTGSDRWPDYAIAPDGSVLAAWGRWDGEPMILGSRSVDGGAWQQEQEVFRPGAAAESDVGLTSVGALDQGAGLAAWDYTADMQDSTVYAAPYAAGGTWGPPVPLGAGGGPKVGMGPQGHGLVVWARGVSEEPYHELWARTAMVTSAPPVHVEDPFVTLGGPFLTGTTATCNEGRWERADGYEYQWLRDGQPIPGATGRDHVIADADRDAELSCTVTARNAFGTRAATSAPASRGVGGITFESDGPPIIFIPGFLASEIECSYADNLPKDNLWPDAMLFTKTNMPQMRLAPDGRSPESPLDPCNRSAGPSGRPFLALAGDGKVEIPRDVPYLGGDYKLPGAMRIHAGTMEWLNRIATENGRKRSVHGFGWDWRKGTDDNLARLDAVIDAARELTGQSQVVIYTHSYGNLLTRHYTDDPNRARKVARVLGIGAPWWGTPKPFVSVAYGIETPVLKPPEGVLDAIMDDGQLRTFVRNLTGIYHLFPSEAWFQRAPERMRNWLRVGGARRDAAGVVKTVRAVGGNGDLLERAYRNHRDHIDGFKETYPGGRVEWEVIAGSGMPTLGPMDPLPLVGSDALLLSLRLSEKLSWLTLEHSWINGDGTVALTSQVQGWPGQAPYSRDGSPVGMNYLCGIGHMDEPEKPGVQLAVQDFLLDGKPVLTTATSNLVDVRPDPCPLDAEEVQIYRFSTPAPTDTTVYDESLGRSTAAAGRPMTLAEAETAGLIRMVGGDRYTAVLSLVDRPLRLQVKGKVALGVARLTDGGRRSSRFHGPVRGPVTVRLKPGTRPAASKRGKPLEATRRDRRPPRTKVRVRRRGKVAVLRATARDTSGVAATMLDLGKGRGRLLRRGRAVKVPAKALRRARVFSVDVFGNVEKPRRVR